MVRAPAKRPDLLFRLLPLLILVGGLALLPVPLGGGILPVFITGFAVLYLAYCWNLVGGMLGEFSLVHMVFWGIGSYAVVAFAGSGWGAWAATACASVIVAAACGVLVVLVARALGVGGFYLSVFTIVVAQIVSAALTNLNLLGGDQGLTQSGTGFDANLEYYLMGGAALVAAGVNLLVLRSRLGLRWLAVRDDELAARSVGIDANGAKIEAYVLSAGLTAMGGAIQAPYLGFVQPGATLNLSFLILALLAVYVGGPGTLRGPALGTMVLYGLSAIAQVASIDATISLYSQLAQYGAALLIIRLSALRRSPFRQFTAWLAPLLPLHTRSAPVLQPLATAVALEPKAHAAGVTSLELFDIKKKFGGLRVLTDVTFSLVPGQIAALVGPNGAGKTTVCNIVSGFLRPDEGRVFLGGLDVTNVAAQKLFRMGVARTFQTPRLFQQLSLEQNVAVAVGSDPERARRTLRRLGIMNTEKSAADAILLERRMTEIARAIVTEPQLLMLDEPLAGLTLDEHDLVLGLLRELADAGAIVMLIDHLIPVIAPVVDRMIVLAHGRLIADGAPAVVLRDPAVVDSYLGQPLTPVA